MAGADMRSRRCDILSPPTAFLGMTICLPEEITLISEGSVAKWRFRDLVVNSQVLCLFGIPQSYNWRQNCWHIHSFNPYFVTVIPFCPPGLAFQPPLTPKQCCVVTAAILSYRKPTLNGGAGSFSTVYYAVIRVVLLRALKVLLKDNLPTNYVADCLRPICRAFAFRIWKKTTNL